VVPSGAALATPIAPDAAAGARNVFDRHRHVPRDVELLREHARRDVGRATGSETDDDANWPIGIAGLRYRRRRYKQRREPNQPCADDFHASSRAAINWYR